MDGVATPLGKHRAQRVVELVLRAEQVPRALVSVAFLTTREIARINRRHLGVSGGTDVISFGFRRRSRLAPVVADIYVGTGVARENAAAAGIPVREELTRLVGHGTLHALGYDHPEGRGREHSAMWRRQEELVRRAMRAVDR